MFLFILGSGWVHNLDVGQLLRHVQQASANSGWKPQGQYCTVDFNIPYRIELYMYSVFRKGIMELVVYSFDTIVIHWNLTEA